MAADDEPRGSFMQRVYERARARNQRLAEEGAAGEGEFGAPADLGQLPQGEPAPQAPQPDNAFMAQFQAPANIPAGEPAPMYKEGAPPTGAYGALVARTPEQVGPPQQQGPQIIQAQPPPLQQGGMGNVMPWNIPEITGTPEQVAAYERFGAQALLAHQAQQHQMERDTHLNNLQGQLSQTRLNQAEEMRQRQLEHGLTQVRMDVANGTIPEEVGRIAIQRIRAGGLDEYQTRSQQSAALQQEIQRHLMSQQAAQNGRNAKIQEDMLHRRDPNTGVITIGGQRMYHNGREVVPLGDEPTVLQQEQNRTARIANDNAERDMYGSTVAELNRRVIEHINYHSPNLHDPNDEFVQRAQQDERDRLGHLRGMANRRILLRQGIAEAVYKDLNVKDDDKAAEIIRRYDATIAAHPELNPASRNNATLERHGMPQLGAPGTGAQGGQGGGNPPPAQVQGFQADLAGVAGHVGNPGGVAVDGRVVGGGAPLGGQAANAQRESAIIYMMSHSRPRFIGGWGGALSRADAERFYDSLNQVGRNDILALLHAGR